MSEKKKINGQRCRSLIVILGDQLNADAEVLTQSDPEKDIIWMAEVLQENTKVLSHKVRSCLFLSAMRHFREALEKRGFRVWYHSLEEENYTTLSEALAAAVSVLRPDAVAWTFPGEWAVREELIETTEKSGLPYREYPDTHFLSSLDEFNAYADTVKQVRMEYFYRRMRRQHDVLMDHGQPAGGAWNYDKENRSAFGKKGPGDLPVPQSFLPDATTRAVMQTVDTYMSDHPGTLEHVDWPVTRKQAFLVLDDFIAHRLPLFGKYEDSMWTDEPFLYHARISSSLNLKLLHPMEVIRAVEQAWQADPDRLPLPAVEGFIRQILGWREFVRGVYWRHMPDYKELNALGATADLPSFYWDANTDMKCMHEVIQQTLDYGYAHHIQRLMVTGLYALLRGVDPKQVHAWYLAVYVDAVEWVELPNTLGMSQFADDGIMASKPYAATGKYIDRMSNYCRQCRYDPAMKTGDSACPFTVLYWDFLMRNRPALSANARMGLQLKNLDRLSEDDVKSIRRRAAALKA